MNKGLRKWTHGRRDERKKGNTFMKRNTFMNKGFRMKIEISKRFDVRAVQSAD